MLLRGDYRSSSRQKRARTAGTRCVSLLASLRVQCVRVLRAEPSRAEPSRTEPSRSIGENVARTLARSHARFVSWPSRAPGTWHASRDQRASPYCCSRSAGSRSTESSGAFDSRRTEDEQSLRPPLDSLLFSSLLLFPSNSSGRAFSPSPPLASFVELVILVSSAAELNPN